jgi:hypothetical protein
MRETTRGACWRDMRGHRMTASTGLDDGWQVWSAHPPTVWHVEVKRPEWNVPLVLDRESTPHAEHLQMLLSSGVLLWREHDGTSDQVPYRIFTPIR